MSKWYPGSRRLTPPRSRSGYRGVIFCPNLKRKKWKAYLRRHGQYLNIGYYPTKEDAARAYNEQAIPGEMYINPLP